MSTTKRELTTGGVFVIIEKLSNQKMWSITQVVVRGRTRNAIGRETGARVRLPDAPPNRMDR